MDKEIIYKRSRRDIVMYLLLAVIADFGCIYAIQSNSVIIGLIGLVIFGACTIYLLFRLIVPNALLTVNKKGIKTKYTKGEFIPWADIAEIYINNDSYKDRPVDVLAIKLKNEKDENKKIKFPKAKSVRGDYNLNLQYSDGKLEDAIKEIKDYYMKNIKPNLN